MKKIMLILMALLVFSGLAMADNGKPDLVIKDVVFENVELLQSVPLPAKVLIENAGDVPVTTRLPFTLGESGWSAFTYFRIGDLIVEEGQEFTIHKPDESIRIEVNTPKEISYHKQALSEKELAKEFEIEKSSFVLEKLREKKLKNNPGVTENEYDPENPTNVEAIGQLEFDIDAEFEKLTDTEKQQFENQWSARKADLMQEEWGKLKAPALTLNPGEVVEIPFEWTFKIKGSPVTYNLSTEPETNSVNIVLDPLNEVVESNEENNVFSKEYPVEASIIFGPREEADFYPALDDEKDYFIFATGNFCTNLNGKEVCHSVSMEKGKKILNLSVDKEEKAKNIGWVSNFLKKFWNFFTGNEEILPKQKVGDTTFRFYKEGIRVTFD